MQLTLSPERPIRNSLGQFIPNHKSTALIGVTFTAKRKRNISRGNKKAVKAGRMKPPAYTGKAVVCIKDGKLISRFENPAEACRNLGVSRGVIGHVCRGERKTFRGCQWFYEKETEKWIHLINE